MRKQKKHLGVVIPASNVTVERELSQIQCSCQRLNEDVYFHFGRAGFDTRYKISAQKYLYEVASNVPEELLKLNKIRLDAYSFFCTSGMLVIKESEKLANLFAENNIDRNSLINPVDSVVAAFELLGCKSPLIITPYEELLSGELVHSFNSNNIYPKKVVSLDLKTGWDIYNYSEEKAITLLDAELSDSIDYDCISILCTNFPTFNLIDEVEKKYALPVITSNQATLFYLLRKSGLNVHLDHLGRLFNNY